MRSLLRNFWILNALLFLSGPGSTWLQAQIVSPQKFIGFEVGADRKLCGWKSIVAYLHLLDEQSDRVLVKELGQSTLGKPFLMAYISSPLNLMNLAKYKNLQKQAAHPRHLSDEDLHLLARKSKAVIMITMNNNANEIASSQASVELAYKLASGTSAELQKILDETIILLIPSLDPDGMQLVVDWYNEYLDTPYEGSPLPHLTHPYVGAENNRDWFMMNLVETRLVSHQCYQEWFPHVIYDQQPLDSQRARLLLPAYGDPLNPNLPAPLFSFMRTLTQEVAHDLQAQKMTGIVRDDSYTLWYGGASVMTPWWHNMIGIHSEVANVRMATPYFFPKGSFGERADRLNDPSWSPSSEPWSGGWWRMRDIMKYEMAAIVSLLKSVAAKKEAIVYNFGKMNKDAIERGRTEPPFAIVIPRQQHDPAAAVRMLKILSFAGVEIHRASEDILTNDGKIEAESYVIFLSQPFGTYLREILLPQSFPAIPEHDNQIVRPYDVTAWTLPLLMAVETFVVQLPFQGSVSEVEKVLYPRGVSVARDKSYLVAHGTSNSFNLVNRLLDHGKKVFWLRNELVIDGETFAPGAIYIPRKTLRPEQLQELTDNLVLEMKQTDMNFNFQPAFKLRPFKLGLYQPFTANVDEGWTRLSLEQFEFPYRTVLNSAINRGNLKADFDALILPDMTSEEIINGRGEDGFDIYSAKIPKPFQGGLSEKGVENLKEFVQKGGTLITLNRACEFAIEKFGLPAENVVKDLPTSEFFCPGSLLEIEVDSASPLAYGMPKKAAAMFLNSLALRPFHWTKKTGVIAYYPEKNPLLSGLLLGEEKLHERSAILDIPMGEGHVLLIGFKAQHRAQALGTMKFLFNAIHLSHAENVILEE